MLKCVCVADKKVQGQQEGLKLNVTRRLLVLVDDIILLDNFTAFVANCEENAEFLLDASK
jgi:hypothetical protein